VGLSRTSYREPPSADARTVELSARIVELAHERRRFGYRRIHDLLIREGHAVNHKRVWRLYRQNNLECDKAIEEPTSKSHQGQRFVPQRKSGCTGAIFPSSRHEPKAWQTGGVHVRVLVVQADQHGFARMGAPGVHRRRDSGFEVRADPAGGPG
jgi:putative transposase